jgi:hypothetical protein
MALPKKTTWVQLNVRVADKLRDKLTKEAKKNGVSLNVWAAMKLGQGFAEEEAFGGDAGRRLLYHLATAFVFAGERYYRDHSKARHETPDVSKWIDTPEAYTAAMLSATQALMLQQPSATLEKCLMQLKSLKGRIATHFLQTTERERTAQKKP